MFADELNAIAQRMESIGHTRTHARGRLLDGLGTELGGDGARPQPPSLRRPPSERSEDE